MGDIWLSENFESINREKKNLRKIKKKKYFNLCKPKTAKTNGISGVFNNVMY